MKWTKKRGAAHTEFQSNLAVSHDNIGNLLSATGHAAEALKSYNAALQIQQKLADSNPAVTKFQSRLARSHYYIGVVLSASGQTAEALKSYAAALQIQQKLADANPAVTEFQSDLAHTHNNIGVLLARTGHAAEALKSYDAALLIRQKLADANPTDVEIQTNLANSHNNNGILLAQTGQPDEALNAYRRALLIRKELAAANPTVIRIRSNMAASHNNIGNLLRATGQSDEALKAYREASLIQQELADDNPTVVEFQGNLANSHNSIGLLLKETGRPAEAINAYKAALVIRENLSRDHPESPDFANGLGGVLNDLALIDIDAKQFEEARARLREAIDWQRKALASNPANSTYRQYLTIHLGNLIKASQGLGDAQGVADAQRQLAELRDSDPAMIALDDRLAAILKGEQPKTISERLQLAQRAYDKGLHASAAKLWGEAMDAEPKVAGSRNPQFRYNAACAAALAGSGQGKDVPAPDEAARAKLREQARGWLVLELAVWGKLVESGPAQARAEIVKTLQHWQGDSDLAGVREAKALEGLPETERKAWQDLWAEVAGLLARSSKP